MQKMPYYLLMLFMFQVIPLQAEPVVITNTKNTISALSKEDVIGLFMGRYSSFPNNQSAIPLDHQPNSALRNEFYILLTNKTASQINAYWARLIFSGRATPPGAPGDKEVILSAVRKNIKAISYIDNKDVDDTVKVVYRFQ